MSVERAPEPRTNGAAGHGVMRSGEPQELTLVQTLAPMISSIIARMEVSHLLDYGCGEAVELAKSLKLTRKLTYQAYDASVPKYSKAAIPAQMVVCLDVTDESLDELKRLTEGVVFLAVTGAMRDWLPKLWDRWDLQTVQIIDEARFFVIGTCSKLIENQEGEKIA